MARAAQLFGQETMLLSLDGGHIWLVIPFFWHEIVGSAECNQFCQAVQSYAASRCTGILRSGV